MTRARPLRALKAGAALLALFTGAAHADTAMPGYGGPGNQLNPGGQPMNLPRDPDGLSQLDDVTRTPTGLLYPLPYQYPGLTQSKTDPDWWTMGWLEGGAMGSFGDRPGSASFGKYADWSSGPILGSAGFLAENRKTADYVSGLAQNVGRSDQYYQLKAGRYGEFNVTAFFDSVPHVYSTEAKSIWDGAGTGNLTLRGGLVPGASTAAEVTAVAAAALFTELQTIRQKTGLSVTYMPSKTIEAALQLTNEEREGTQPISATFGYPFVNGATQIIQPIHYRTVDINTALRYKDDALQANLTYAGSFFRNALSALVWQNPGLEQASAGAFIPTQGQLSLPPSNNYNSFKGDVTALLSPDMRFSASLSYSLMRQDEALLPPTIASGITNSAGGPINLANWNSTGALSQLRAGAAIDLFNAFAQFQYVVSPDLTFDFELRDHSEMNRTNYVSYNPLTGQYGYPAIDGALGAVIPSLSGIYQPNAPGSVVQIRDMPFANDNLQLIARTSWRMDTHLKLDFTLTHNSIHHSVREVQDADDNRVRLQLAATGYSWGTLRASYEFGSLRGSDYTSNPYTAYYSQSLPGYVPKSATGGDVPFTLADLRKFDVGDRDEHVFHVQGNAIVSPRTDLQVTGDAKLDDYDALYGLRASSSYDVNADVNYQLSTTATLTGFFTLQVQHRNMASINDTGATGSAAAGGADYPLANAWSETVGEHDYTAGFTAHQSWDTVSLDVNYIFTRGDSAVGYRYASTGAFFGLLSAAQAGNAFPDILFDSHSLEANVRWQAAPTLSYRLLYRVDFQDINDFHYAGLQPVISNNTYLGVAPENFTAQTIGFFMQYTF